MDEERLMNGMRMLRLISALVEVSAVVMMFRLTRLEMLVRLNAGLGLVGPAIFIGVSALGLAGLAGKLNPLKLAMVFAGVAMVIIGTKPD